MIQHQSPATDQEPIIRLEKVTRSFGPLRVLDAVDLTLYRGQTCVIIGESGTGKSVLLKHLVGLLRPDSGAVFFHDQRMDTLREKEWVEPRKRFGFLFQLSALFDSLTVAENVAFPLAIHTRKSRKQVEETVAEKLRLVGLEGLQPRRIGELSGGQKKRVALARAIALDPEVILYDEPTTGLDPPRADVINELILKLKHAVHATSVVVTHDMSSAFKVADRIIMLSRGSFIFDGTPGELRSCRNPVVNRFITGRASEADLHDLGQYRQGAQQTE